MHKILNGAQSAYFNFSYLHIYGKRLKVKIKKKHFFPT